MGDYFGVGCEVVVYGMAWWCVGALGPNSTPEIFDNFGSEFGFGGGGVSNLGSEGGEGSFGVG